MEIQKQYQKTLDYLYSFVDYSMTRSFRNAPGAFDLGRMRTLMTKLGNPEARYPTIHIAGTKGKGSVAAMCHAVLKTAGYKVGLYTSPHLLDYAERIQVNQTLIRHDRLIELVEEVKPVIESIPRLTTFEITTALAFLYFAHENVDAAVVEVGLGGRLDATNVLTPVVSVITALSFDHTNLLGNTLAKIAAEKGGIIKPGVPVVMAPQDPEASEVIERIAAKRMAPLTRVGQEVLYEPETHSLDGQTLVVRQVDGMGEPERLQIPLLGLHQVENAVTAFAALKIFQQHGLTLKEESLQNGFKETKWPGRFEILQREPPVVIDCAHNRISAVRLRQTLDDYFPGRPVTLVLGASEDKDINGILEALAPISQEVFATRSFHPRAMGTEIILEAARKQDLPVTVIPDIADAFRAAIQLADEDTIVLATGSIFIAAGAKEAWPQIQVRRQSSDKVLSVPDEK